METGCPTETVSTSALGVALGEIHVEGERRLHPHVSCHGELHSHVACQGGLHPRGQ